MDKADTPSTSQVSTSISTIPRLLLDAAAAAFGNSFCTVAVAVLVANVQLAVPQVYPEGQHPATGPASSPHKNQPEAQVAVGWVSPPPAAAAVAACCASETGTAMVAPLEIIVVMGGGGAGQDVVLQSRPVRQHPPGPWRARQA
ncbi:hypothetical protein PC116_g34750 [Phytophthora cactorum]|nr:hypothetical protein PC116_g34750 [Phytophthora cactorum]